MLEVVVLEVHSEDLVERRVLARVLLVVRFNFFRAHAEDDVDVVLAEHVGAPQIATRDLADGQLV